MRTVDNLIGLHEISTLLQYLYMDEDNSILVDNAVTTLEIRMKDNFEFTAKNLRFPDLPPLRYTEEMTVSCMLAIIDQLKTKSPQVYMSMNNRWEEISNLTLSNVCLNNMRHKNREY